MTDIIVEDEAGSETKPVAVAPPAETHEEMGNVRETIGRHEEQLAQHEAKHALHEAKLAEHEAKFGEIEEHRRWDGEERERLWTAHREAMEAIEALKPVEVGAEIIAPPIATVVEENKAAPEGTESKKGRLRLFGSKK